MKEEKNYDDIPFTKRPPTGRVLVWVVKAKPRAYISLMFGGNLHRPGDWADIGFEAWEAEVDRREQIHDLMTDDEKELFDKYCWLRDD